MLCEQRANYVLDPHLPLTETTFSAPPALLERRTKPRSTRPLNARVWGVDVDDHPFSFDCLLENISASGTVPAFVPPNEIFGADQRDRQTRAWSISGCERGNQRKCNAERDKS